MDIKKIQKRFLPMSETTYYIMLSLVVERHGYGIIKDVENKTKGRIRLGAGTVYGTLSKLDSQNLIQEEYLVDRRKIYSLTELGKKLLLLEIQRLEKLCQNGIEIKEEL